MATFLVDGHEDIASNALHGSRDVRLPIAHIRERERNARTESIVGSGGDQTAMVALPEHRRGGVGLVFATIFCMPSDPETMATQALAQLRYYQDLARTEPNVRLITSQRELATLEHDWAAASTPDERPVGMVLLMEGADGLRDPSELEEWYHEGLRIVGLSWRNTRYAGGTGNPGPLTEMGRDLLGEMARLGVIFDVSHLAEESFWQALDLFSGPTIASHANCRAFVPTDRQLSDDMIRALVARDAVIGVVLANRFLVESWTPEAGPVGLEAVVRHIDHVRELAGNARHSALGSDFDGGFGVETTPVAFDTVGDLGRLGEALTAAGYTSDEVTGILGGNWLRFLRAALPAE